MSVERMLRKSLRGASHSEGTGKPCLSKRRCPSREQLPQVLGKERDCCAQLTSGGCTC